MTEPSSIAGFAVLRRLGQGGMGTVLLVVDPATGAQRALKVLGPGASPDELQRFRREAQAMAAVDDHPAVLRIHSAGEHEGRPFYVMDLAPGGDLSDRLSKGPLPPAEVVRLGAALARGLAHVHSRGVLHRDLKPQNVLFDEAGAPRLVDFGLARLAGAERLTVSGTIMGTACYMAPEQAEGRTDLDARTDVYGLGALLYHAAVGCPPFARQTMMATLYAVLEEPPPPPRALAPGVPPELEALLLRALAKDRAARFPSAGAMAEALEALPTDAPPPPPRRWPLVALAAVGAAALGVVAVLLARPAPSSPSAPPPTSPGPSTVRRRSPPAASPLDEDALERWLGSQDVRAAWTYLEAATGADPDAVLAWVAAFRLAAGDARTETVAHAAGRTTAAAEWEHAAACLAGGAPPPTTLPGGVLRRFEQARAAVVAWTFDYDLERLRALLTTLLQHTAPGDCPHPVKRGLSLRAQAAVWGRRGQLIAVLRELEDKPEARASLRALLEQVAKLAPRSGHGLGLSAIELGGGAIGDRRGEAWRVLRELDAEVTALPPERFSDVQRVFAALLLAVLPDRPLDEAEWARARQANEALVALADGERLLEAGAMRKAEDSPLYGQVLSATLAFSHAAFERAWRLEQAAPGAAMEEALAAGRRLPPHVRGVHEARVHLARRELALAGPALSPQQGRGYYENLLDLVLRFERALLDPQGGQEALDLWPSLAQVEPQSSAHSCWEALIAALRKDQPGVAAALAAAEQRGEGAFTRLAVPWRTPRRTREDLAGLRKD